MLSNKYFTSEKFLDLKEREVLKYYKDYTIERFITLLGAPFSFIEENDLPPYELKKKRK